MKKAIATKPGEPTKFVDLTSSEKKQRAAEEKRERKAMKQEAKLKYKRERRNLIQKESPEGDQLDAFHKQREHAAALIADAKAELEQDVTDLERVIALLIEAHTPIDELKNVDRQLKSIKKRAPKPKD